MQDTLVFGVMALVIVGLMALRMRIRAAQRAGWRVIFNELGHRDDRAIDIHNELQRAGLDSRLSYGGPGGSPTMGMSGQQVVVVEVRAREFHRARELMARFESEGPHYPTQPDQDLRTRR